MTVIFKDDCTRPPIEVWKGVDALTLSRIVQKSGYQEMKLVDGDNAKAWTSPTSYSGTSGERCEVGRNSITYAPFLYSEGMHAKTTVKYRLPSSFPIKSTLFQSLMQMKQTGASNLSPVIGLNAARGNWELMHCKPDGVVERIWTGTPKLGMWETFIFDVVYSNDPSRGKIKLFRGSSLVFDVTTNTLVENKPSHLRRGIYRAPSLSGDVTIHRGVTIVDKI